MTTVKNFRYVLNHSCHRIQGVTDVTLRALRGVNTGRGRLFSTAGAGCSSVLVSATVPEGEMVTVAGGSFTLSAGLGGYCGRACAGGCDDAEEEEDVEVKDWTVASLTHELVGAICSGMLTGYGSCGATPSSASSTGLGGAVRDIPERSGRAVNVESYP